MHYVLALLSVIRTVGAERGARGLGTARRRMPGGTGPLVPPGRRPVGDGRTGDASGRVGQRAAESES